MVLTGGLICRWAYRCLKGRPTSSYVHAGTDTHNNDLGTSGRV